VVTRIQITIDCADPDRMARFWAQALRWSLQEPPSGFPSWGESWLSRGVAVAELGDGYDAMVDPQGVAPRIRFQLVPEGKVVKNRLHLDLRASGEGAPLEICKQQIEAEVERLVQLGAPRVGVVPTTARDHYAVAMLDPEGNEFDLNQPGSPPRLAPWAVGVG
jgi:hypothetical protein